MDAMSVAPSVFDIVPVATGDGSDVSQLKVLRVIRILRLVKMIRLVRASRLYKRWEVTTPDWLPFEPHPSRLALQLSPSPLYWISRRVW